MPSLLLALTLLLPAAAPAMLSTSMPVPARPPALAASPTAAATEEWHGWIRQGEREVPLGLTLRSDQPPVGTRQAELWLPDQGVRGQLAALTKSGDSDGLRVQLSQWPGQPTLTLKRTGQGRASILQGSFSQGAYRAPVTLWPGRVTLPARPQEPRPPLPYRTQEVTVLGEGAVPLRGTLTLPAGQGPFPAALLVSGSGPQDRDSTLHGHRPFLVLADYLTRQGYAVLRLDDRGTGGSGGDLYTSRYRDLSGDLVQAVTFLRHHPAVRAEQVGLIGHSEGSSLAVMAAQQLQPAPAYLVLLTGPGVTGAELLDQQLRAQLNASGLNATQIEARAALQRQALAGQALRPDHTDLSGSEVEQAWLHSRPFVQSPYLRDFVTYDPRPALRRNQVPTLALFGERDLQVPRAAGYLPMQLLDTQPGNLVRELPGLNHLLQPARSGLPSEYAQQSVTLDPAALHQISGWLNTTLKR